jgi:ABC-type nitrate/sulfonate/bicarbonate transport system substrate-binding protein
MDRRAFLRLGAAGAGLLAAGPVIAACGSSSSAGSSGSSGQMAYQLSWIKNFQFAGEYIADSRGYFKDAGLTVDLLAGGPSIAVDAVAESGKALVTQSSPDFTANAVAAGADLKIIGASYQRSPFSIISTGTPITSPADFAGKTIGIQAVNQVAWDAFLKINNIDASTFKQVPVQHDLTPLVSGEVDGFWGYSNDDAVQLREKGNNITVMMLADFGYLLPTGTYTVRADTLSDPDKRAQVIAFMKADIHGWQDAIADPAAGAKLAVDVYGKDNGLDLAGQTASCIASNDLMVTDETKVNGLFTMTSALCDKSLETLAAGGITANEAIFDMSVLDEIYSAGPTLS